MMLLQNQSLPMIAATNNLFTGEQMLCANRRPLDMDEPMHPVCRPTQNFSWFPKMMPHSTRDEDSEDGNSPALVHPWFNQHHLATLSSFGNQAYYDNKFHAISLGTRYESPCAQIAKLQEIKASYPSPFCNPSMIANQLRTNDARNSPQEPASRSSSPEVNQQSYALKLTGGVLPPSTTPSVKAAASESKTGGKKTWKVILTAELAAAIYQLRPPENAKKSSSVRLSRRYGVSPKTIRDIWNKATWTKATRPLWEPDCQLPEGLTSPGRRRSSAAAARQRTAAAARAAAAVPQGPAEVLPQAAAAAPSRAEAISVHALAQ